MLAWAISVCTCVRNYVRMSQPVMVNQKHFLDGYETAH